MGSINPTAAIAAAAGVAVLAGILVLRNAVRAVDTVPHQLASVVRPPWTAEEIQAAYDKAQATPTDVRPFLFAKRQRRYVVVGGGGLVGSWIVKHLLLRGEDPRAIRVLDLAPQTRPDLAGSGIDHIVTDITKAESVSQAFDKPWHNDVKSWPMTVFHTAAYINPAERKADFLGAYVAVNVKGTENVLESARRVGASCFVSTSSASVGLVPPTYLPWPWQSQGKDIVQICPNAEPKDLNAPLESFNACYVWSKAQGEKRVRAANDPAGNFLTGVIRPGHAIYGHGIESAGSLTWTYVSRGGGPSWLGNIVTQFVCAQNVSIGHLAFENALLEGSKVGGQAYFVTDGGPPLQYKYLYSVLEQLVDPSTPVKFPKVPFLMMLAMAYSVETYVLLQRRYLSFLPKLSGEMYFLQPATLNLSTLHILYSDASARSVLGYKPALTTLEGFALAALEWNQRVDRDKQQKEGLTITAATRSGK